MKSPRPFYPLALLLRALPALALFATGCIGVMPLPQFSNQPTHGTKLRPQDTAFIRVGVTPAPKLFGALGTNCICAPRERAVAFPWELPGGRGIWWYYIVGGQMSGGGGGDFEWTRWRAFFVAFDSNNIVIAANSKHLSPSKSLHEQLELWAIKHHAAPNLIHPDTFAVEVP